MFDQEFLATLSQDPVAGAIRVCDVAIMDAANCQDWGDAYGSLIESFALIDGMIAAELLTVDIPQPRIVGSSTEDPRLIVEYLGKVKSLCEERASLMKMDSLKAHFRVALGAGFAYEFSDGDLELIQNLLNQLRDLVAASTLFEKDHQRRILARLERLQSELHKRTADLDRFWGLIGDAGVAIGKFGKEAKPIVDRIREVTDIVWRTQARAEELPSSSPTPLLAKPDAEE